MSDVFDIEPGARVAGALQVGDVVAVIADDVLTDNDVLAYDAADGKLHPVPNSAGSVTSVVVTAPIVDTGTASVPNIGISAASGAVAGSMSAADFSKLAGVAVGATNTPLSNAAPQEVGAAAAGVGASASRDDHVHALPSVVVVATRLEVPTIGVSAAAQHASPSGTGDLLSTDSAATVSNKAISGVSNTLSNISLTSAVTGVLPIANGGTNSATGDLVATTSLTSPLLQSGAGVGLTLNGTAVGLTLQTLGVNRAVFGSANATWSVNHVLGADNTYSNGSGSTRWSNVGTRIVSSGDVSLLLRSGVADGASAIGTTFNNTTTLANGSAELAEFQNNGSRVAAVLATGGLLAPTVGPNATQQHTLPAVASDTVVLLGASQALTGKTYAGTTGNFTTSVTTPTVTNVASLNLTTSNTATLNGNEVNLNINTVNKVNVNATELTSVRIVAPSIGTTTGTQHAFPTGTATLLATDSSLNASNVSSGTLAAARMETVGPGAVTSSNPTAITTDVQGRITAVTTTTNALAGIVQASAGGALAAGTTYYAKGVGVAPTTAGDYVLYVAPNAKTVRNLSGLSLTTGGSVTVTLRKFNGSAWADTSVTATGTTSPLTFSDTSNSFTLAANEAVAAKVVTSGGFSGTDCVLLFEVFPQ